MLDINAVLELEGPKFLLNLDASSIFIVPLFTTSSIWVSAAIKALKIENIDQINTYDI